MTRTRTDQTVALLGTFLASAAADGLRLGRRRSVVSHHDPSVRFTNSTISALKAELEADPVVPIALHQPALRLRNLDHIAATGRSSAYGCSFHAFGTLWPVTDQHRAYALTRTLLTDLAPGTEPVLAAAAADADLIALGRDTGWPVALDPGPVAPYRHVFGLPGVTGRNTNVALRTGRGDVPVGNLITIERDGRPFATEAAFGVNTVLVAAAGLDHPIRATPAADVAADVGGDADLVLLDALMTAAVLALEGLRPAARGRNGRYREVLRLLVQRWAGPPDALAAALAETVAAEVAVRAHGSPLHPDDTELEEAAARAAVVEHLTRVQ